MQHTHNQDSVWMNQIKDDVVAYLKPPQTIADRVAGAADGRIFR